jgi:hypothetical protein
MPDSGWQDTCSRCGNTVFWWRSSAGYKVCYVCHRDVFDALECLGRRVPGGVRQVQSWGLREPVAAGQP